MREIMRGMGLAIMGTGKASGENRAREAAEQAISSPLLENMSIVGARGVLLNISGGLDLGLHEISEAASVIYEKADENANIILGSVIDPSLENEVIVTIIATGFNPVEKEQDSHVDGAVRIAEEVVVGKREQKEDVAHNNDMHMNAENIKADDLDVPTFLRRQGSSASTDQTIE
jgi:cell division protein FtsZ